MDRISWFFLELLMRPRRDESGALSLEWSVIAAALLAAAILCVTAGDRTPSSPNQTNPFVLTSIK